MNIKSPSRFQNLIKLVQRRGEETAVLPRSNSLNSVSFLVLIWELSMIARIGSSMYLPGQKVVIIVGVLLHSGVGGKNRGKRVAK
jgi:hypothetical protein